MIHKSTRIAIAALLHDLGKLAERAGIETTQERLEVHKQLYCPQHKDFTDARGWFSHIHAAYTGIAWDALESTGHFPDLRRASPPFADGSDDITDSAVNAASAHHRPDTFLQWIVATADRVASGFERDLFEDYNRQKEDNHYRARLLTLFEQIGRTELKQDDLTWRYPLKSLSPQSIFPQAKSAITPKDDKEARTEYHALWNNLLEGIQQIPKSHVNNLPLWLDHFDSLWLNMTHAIPAATAFGVKPEVSLYDHSKATAALATALWRWHDAHGQTDDIAVRALKERSDWAEDKFLLIQGDFFGIQDFIFTDGSQTNKAAAKLLRGRSFQVSLFTELAALRVLEVCALPSTSQIINAAGKFLIVAPNTPEIREKLAATRRELNAWFLEQSFGLAGLGLVGKTASCNDFLQGSFNTLIESLFTQLEKAKLQKLDLTGNTPTVFPTDYPHGICPYNSKLPADKSGSAALSRDQISLGTGVTRQERLLIIRDGTAMRAGSVRMLETPIFGYRIGFTSDEDRSGKFGQLADNDFLVRCWDISLPENLDAQLWNGYGRRHINAYTPRFTETDQWGWDKYGNHTDDVDFDRATYAGKTLNHIACEDREPHPDKDGWQGQVALMTLKGDVDNLGQIFQKGLKQPSFAKMAALSRQMNAFFAVWLPAWCAQHAPNTYTVFAGGDDFFLIGSWRSAQKLAGAMAEQFSVYVGNNPEIHFSVGMVMSKPGQPIHTLAAQADEALDSAKSNGKNAIVLFGERVTWGEHWQQVQSAQQRLDEVRETYRLSTGYVYGLLTLIDLAADRNNPESAMWRSRLAYRTRRYVVDKLPAEQRQRAQTELTVALGEHGIKNLGTAYRIPLFNHFYRQR